VPHTVGLVSSLVNIEHLRIAVGLQGSRPIDNGRVTMSHVAMHPRFNATDRSYDLALARLSSPLDFDDQVRPVCMPRSSNEVFGTHSQCVVTGLAYTPFSGYYSRRCLRFVMIQFNEISNGALAFVWFLLFIFFWSRVLD